MPVAIVDSFKNLRLMPDDVTVVADRTSDTLTLEGGIGVNLSYNVENDSIVIYNSGQGLVSIDDSLEIGNTTNRSLKIGTLAINGGTGLTLNWADGVGGAVPASTTIVTGGGGYIVGDVITVVGGDENATFTVATVSSGGVVTSITQLAPGTGYPVNSLDNQPTSTPTRAQLEADINTTLTIRTSGSGTVFIDSNKALRIPVGDNAVRPAGITGQIRFNSDTTQFEGYNGIAWTSLGGIRDVDGNTYIVPETTPGTNENQLKFIADGITVATMDTQYAKFLAKGFVLPGGATVDRPVGVTGSVRFNTETLQFEGFDGSSWISIGSVRDVDGNTYIIPETVPGANENTLYFYTNNFLAATLSTTAFTLNNDLVLTNNQSVFLREDSANGTNAVEIKAAANMPASYTLKMPTTIGENGNLLGLNADGQLEFVVSDSFGGGRVTVSADFGDDNYDGISKAVKTVKRALQIASELVYNPDGTTNGKKVVVSVASGDYVEDNPIIIPDNVSVIGSGLRACNMRPLNANKDFLRVRNGCYFTEFTFRDHLDVDGVPDWTFDYAVAFDDPTDINTDRTDYTYLPTSKPVIDTSPYIQNCSIISFLGGNGALVDGRLVDTPNIPQFQIQAENPVDGPTPEQGKSMVANAFTMLTFGGTAWRVTNDAYIQIVSCFQIFALNGTYCQSGGYASITNSATNFGLYALRASGYSPNAFQFDKGIVAATGTANSKQTITALGFGRTPTQDYIIRFRDPAYRQAYDLLLANKDSIVSQTSAWIDSQIAGNISPFVSYNYTGSNRTKGERDIGLAIDAVALDILTGGNSNSVIAGLSFKDLATGIYDICAASITYAKGLSQTAITSTGLSTYAGTKFNIIINAITNPAGVPASVGFSSDGDITNTYKPASVATSFDAAVAVNPTNNVITINSHGLNNGDALIYDSNGNPDIVGLDDEQTYYVIYNDANSFKLAYDETLRLEADVISVGTGTHKFVRDLQEFYIDDLLESHSSYQELVLAASPGNYEFTPGNVITGVTGANTNNAYIHSYDPVTRTLVVSLNKVTVGSSSIRNAFDDTSTIDSDDSGSPITNIGVDSTISRNDLYSATFSIQSTTTAGQLTSLITLPNKQIWLHRPSIVNSSGHTWEYAGAGTDYNALPQNGGQTRGEYEQFSDLPGRVYSSGTNELGDFKVGSFIIAENRTGNVSFTNKVSVNQLDALRLGIGGITIEAISDDVDLGDNEPGGATNTRLSTQLAIRSFLENRLGNFIDKSVSTNAVPGAVIQLNASGQINSDLLPSVRSFTAAKAEGYYGRLSLIEEVPASDFLDGDIVTETYSTVALTLSANVTALMGSSVTQAVTGATGYLVSDVTASNVVTVASNGLVFNAAFDTTNNLTIAGDSTPSDANGTVKPNLVGSVANNVNANYVLSNSNAGQYLILNSAGTYSFTNGNVITSANDQVQGNIASSRYGVVKTVNNASFTNGTGYTPASGTATYKSVPLTGGSGSGAVADITVTNGSVSSIDMRRGGINYNIGDPLSAAAGNVGGTVTIPFAIPVTVIEKRLYLTLIGGEKFTATSTSPNYIADNNAQVNTITLTNSTTKSFNAADVGSSGNVDYSTSRITISTHGFANGDPIVYTSAPNVAIGGVTNGLVYYVKAVDASTVELYDNFALVSKITFTSSSSGTHSLTTRVANILDNSFYIPAHPYATGDALQLTGTSLPTVDGTALVSGGFYFAGSVTTNSFTIHSSRSEALSSVNGLVTNAIDFDGTGSGSATFRRQNVSVFGVVNTSSTNANNWSPLSTTNVDASNIISGVVNTSRLAGSGSANDTTYLRGDSTWHTVVQSLKETSSPITLTGSYTTSGLENLYYGDIALDIERVDSASGDANYTNLGVAKFIKTQFQVGTGAGVGEVYIKDGVIDAGTLDSYDSSYILNSANHSIQPVNKGGTNISTYAIGDLTYASASAVLAKLPIGANNTVLTSTGSAPSWSTSLNLAGNLSVAGNLTVSGSTITINTSTMSVNDKNIELGAVEAVTGLSATISTGNTTVTLSSTAGLIPGMTVTKTAGVGVFGASPYIASVDSATQITLNVQHATSGAITFTANGVTDLTANGGGITLKGATDKTIVWDSTNTNWTASEHWNLASGKSFKINNVEVLTSTKVLNRTPGGTTAGDIVTIDATQTLTNKTLTSPTFSSIVNTGTLTLPTSTDTLVGRATTDTLTNKTLTTPKISDSALNNAYIFASSDLAADRTVTLPLLTTNDTFVFADHTQTLNNKTLTNVKISSISNTGTITLPVSTDTLVGRATTDTLTNKTLVDSTTWFQDEVTATKQMKFQLSGISADTTRTLTVPNVDGTIVTTGDTGTVTSTMIADSTIVNADISSTANINFTKLSAYTISGINLGSNLNTLTRGSYLTGNDYNGGTATTWAVDATTNATVSKIVARDASGRIMVGSGSNGGIAFPNDAFGGSGDTATITLQSPAGGEATRMTFTMTNDADDMISFVVPSNDGVLVNGNKVWHAGNSSAFLRSDEAGDWGLASSTNGTTGYNTSTLELRESNFGGATYTAPRLGFHWGGVVASQIGIEATGRIAILNNPGTGYENLIAATYYGTGLSTGADATAGTIQGNWTLTGASKLQATYADLAEKYVADAEYEEGTVVQFGGEYEVTIAGNETRKVAGVISINPAYVMNAECQGEFVATIALQGRVPVKVIGKVEKGDMLVSAGNGVAKADYDPRMGTVIGKALENYCSTEVGIIEAVVGRL